MKLQLLLLIICGNIFSADNINPDYSDMLNPDPQAICMLETALTRLEQPFVVFHCWDPNGLRGGEVYLPQTSPLVQRSLLLKHFLEQSRGQAIRVQASKVPYVVFLILEQLINDPHSAWHQVNFPAEYRKAFRGITTDLQIEGFHF